MEQQQFTSFNTIIFWCWQKLSKKSLSSIGVVWKSLVIMSKVVPPNQLEWVLESGGSRELKATPTSQVGGLWLYPGLMRAAQLQNPFSKSIKGAKKSRAVIGSATDHSGLRAGGRPVRTRRPSWRALPGMREGEGPPGREAECVNVL